MARPARVVVVLGIAAQGWATEGLATLKPGEVAVRFEPPDAMAPFTVNGRGAFFEANVNWELLQDGQVVDEGFTTAEEGMTLSPYSFEVTADPGDYVLRVFEKDMSDGEGSGSPEDTKRITVVE